MAPDTVAQARYRIIDSLGRGGMGEVCLADDLMLHRQVALKFLTAPDESESSDQLLAEARAAAALDHPFICSIYEVTTINDRSCIAMEFVRGETLERRLRRGPLPLAEGLRVAEEMAEALEAAHKRRIIHRDLKPANVMFTEDQHIKVMDFGLATRLPADDHFLETAGWSTATDALCGTPAYMAPEQIRGEPPDRRSDIFAFGVLLYELLSGTHPFCRIGVDATLAAILREHIPPLHDRLPSIPARVSDVVDRMLTKDPAARYQSFGDVRRDLRRVAVELSAPSIAAPAVAVDRTPRHGGARLIGRDTERALLLDCLSQAGSGHGGLVVLSGDAGIGKTRLAEEALDSARSRGWQTLIGRCYQQDGTPPLIPYIEVLEAASRLMPASAFRQAIGPSAPELAKLLPELHHLLPGMPAPLELPTALRQRFLFTNVREFLTRCSRFAPLVIVIDDLQWSDEATLQLTQHLAQHLATLPILVIAAYREADSTTSRSKGALQHLLNRARGRLPGALDPDAIKLALDEFVGQGRARVISVRAFSESDVRSMLTSLGDDDPPARLVRAFFQQTGGNPFFVAELFRHLNEEGRLLDARKQWVRDVDLNDIDVPESVRAVLDRRVQRMSAETQRVLTVAAVIGDHFELELLEAVAGVDSETLIAALDEAERARLLKGPSGRQDVTWRFAHQLICQTLTRTLSTLRLQRLHLQIAEAMERLDSSSRTYTSGIAHHLYCAGRLVKAARTARALTTAGDAAHAIYATEEAVQHYHHALEVLEEAGDDESARRAVQELLADLLGLLGDRAAAMKQYGALSAVYDAAESRLERARISRKMGTLHWQAGDRGHAMSCYQWALQACEGSPAHVETAQLYQELGWAAFRSGDNRQAVEWAERALHSAKRALAETTSATPREQKAAMATIAHATNTIGVALARSGDLDGAREQVEASVTTARELGLLDVVCRGYANLGVLYSTVEPKRAIDVSLTGLELASKIGAASLQSYIYANLAAAYCALTERCETEGLQAAQASVDLDRRLGQLDHLAVPLVVMAQIQQCRGELDTAQQNYQEALALAEQAGEPQLILPCYDGLATIYLDRGDKVRAAQYMEKARELCDRTGLDPDALLLLPFLS